MKRRSRPIVTYAITKLKPYMETPRGKNIQKMLLNEAILAKLQVKNSNEPNVKNFKHKLKNVYNVYKMRNTPNSFNKGIYAGRKLTNAIFEFYESQANRQRFKNSNAFTKGLKSGIRERLIFWIPGSFARGVIRGFQYNTSKFMKRAQSVKGVDNIHRLFSVNNKNDNRNRSSSKSPSR